MKLRTAYRTETWTVTPNQWWTNFVKDSVVNEREALRKSDWESLINKKLKPHRATISHTYDPGYTIEFEHEEDATLFLLRWS